MENMFRFCLELYKKMFENITSYYKFSTRAFEKFMENYDHKSGVYGTNAKRRTYPANGHEIYNYVARFGVSNLQIQAVMKLDGKLDFDRLQRAVRLSLDAEPILKCRFIEDDPPYWEPLENIGVVNFCSLKEVEDVDTAVQDFIESTVNLDKDPMINVRLIRSEQYDVLAFKINHTCCDGAGAKEYIQLLAEIYDSIGSQDDTYTPVTRIGGRKDQDRLFEELGITNIESLFIPGADLFQPSWPFPWEPCGSNTACMCVSNYPAGFLEELKKYAKANGATVNDVILTACYRAMLEVKHPVYGTPMEIPITVDLRRYLPDNRTQAIRNFSGSINTRLDMVPAEAFNETLQRVIAMMQEIKKDYPGLQSAIGLERVERISFYEILSYYQAVMETKKTQLFCPLYCGDRCVPTLSNLGYMSVSPIKFGDITVTDTYLLPPVVRAPGLLLMASSYGSVFTLATGYFKGTVDGENVEKLLDKIKQELMEGCNG